ncbi:hypothetical protein ACLB2K_046479 [Fragaria x ananassa]
MVVEHLDWPDLDCWPGVGRTRKDLSVIDKTSLSFTFGRRRRLLSASSRRRPRHPVAVVDVFCSGVDIRIVQVAFTPLDRRRRRRRSRRHLTPPPDRSTTDHVILPRGSPITLKNFSSLTSSKTCAPPTAMRSAPDKDFETISG